MTATVTEEVTEVETATATATETVAPPPPAPTSQPAPPPSTQALAPETSAAQLDPEPIPVQYFYTDAEIRTEVGEAFGVVDQYWKDLFVYWKAPAWWTPNLYHGDGFYDSPRERVPGCLGDYENAQNAYFCPDGYYMAWDLDFFRKWSIGDASFYAFVAHETAHAAQYRFIADDQGPAVLTNDEDSRELQADCIAGATLAKAAQDGYLLIEPGDVEIVAYVAQIGDDTEAGIHGTSAERVASFKLGFYGDIESCLGNRQR